MNVIRPHGQRMVLVTLTRQDGSRWKIALEYCNVEHMQEGRMGTRQHLGEAVVVVGWLDLVEEQEASWRALADISGPRRWLGRPDTWTTAPRPPLLGLVELDI